MLGGQRDPSDPWDFYDVPVPALNATNGTGTRDGAVTISDVMAVLNYDGTRAGGPANDRGASYDADLNHNGIPDGREYDRSGAILAHWRSGAPDGSVTISDVVIAVAQVGDRCAR